MHVPVRYVKIPYTGFRVGDIVEVSFGLIAVPTTSGMRCMKLVLRGLSLESTEFTTVSDQNTFYIHIIYYVPKAMSLKRAMLITEGKKRKRPESDEEKAKSKVNFSHARCYGEEEDLDKEIQEADGQMSKMDLESGTAKGM